MPKISSLPALATVSGNILIPVVQDGVTKKATLTQLGVGGGGLTGWTSSSTGTIAPITDNLQDIGTPSLRVRHIYVGPGSISIGTGTISMSASGSLVLPGVTSASSYIAREVQDIADQTTVWADTPVVIDAYNFSVLNGDVVTPEVGWTTATYTAEGIDGDGFITGISVTTGGTGYSGVVADAASGPMYAAPLGTVTDPFTTSTWVQIPFVVQSGAGEVTFSGGGGSSSPATNETLGTVLGSTVIDDPLMNISFGQFAGKADTLGNSNIAIGIHALQCNAGSVDPTYGAYYGSYNVAVGNCALRCNINGYGNVSMGWEAMERNQYGSNNVAQGYQALKFNNGSSNIAQGYQALLNNNIGTNNVAVGVHALGQNCVGSNNIAIGNGAAYLSLGNFNIGIGTEALYSNCNGYGNVGIGSYSLHNTVDVECNTALGYCAGNANTLGTNNTFIGAFSAGASASSSNTITLGNSAITTIRAQVTTITALSDCRDKTNITGIPIGLNFIREVNPVQFDWNMRDGAKVGIPEMGFIAQELNALQQKYNVKGTLNLVLDENPDKLEATPGKLLPVLVKAIQDLAVDNDRLSAQVATLQTQVDMLLAKP